MKKKMSQEEMICTMSTLHYMMMYEAMMYTIAIISMFFFVTSEEIFNMIYFFGASVVCFFAGYWLQNKIRRFYKRLELK